MFACREKFKLKKKAVCVVQGGCSSLNSGMGRIWGCGKGPSVGLRCFSTPLRTSEKAVLGLGGGPLAWCGLLTSGWSLFLGVCFLDRSVFWDSELDLSSDEPGFSSFLLKNTNNFCTALHSKDKKACNDKTFERIFWKIFSKYSKPYFVSKLRPDWWAIFQPPKKYQKHTCLIKHLHRPDCVLQTESFICEWTALLLWKSAASHFLHCVRTKAQRWHLLDQLVSYRHSETPHPTSILSSLAAVCGKHPTHTASHMNIEMDVKQSWAHIKHMLE